MPIFFTDPSAQIEQHQIERRRLKIDSQELIKKLEANSKRPPGIERGQARQALTAQFEAIQQEKKRLDWAGAFFGYDAQKGEPAPPRF